MVFSETIYLNNIVPSPCQWFYTTTTVQSNKANLQAVL
ncbi:Uncharacterised protein [Klebsiella pneumoniae]|nr:Uncharacterised protein [Klebsiella pneumoniae]